MALPADGQNANDLTKVTEIPAGKELIFFDPTTNEGGIITLENLTKQILNGLTKQTFALDAGQQTILQALNTLNSDKANYGSYTDDLNNIPVIVNEQTIYRVIPNCKNSPAPGEHGILRTMYIDNSKYAIQEFLSHANTKLFIRSKSNNVWGNWVEK
jgi:hypothetical protein